MKLAPQIISKVLFFLIVFLFYACGQSIGYKEVESEIRYYHSTDPEWLPSAAGPGKKSVYIRLKNVNKNKFKIFGIIAKDDQNIWYAGKPIIGADSESFEVLDGPYQKDKSSVYFNGKPIIGLQSDSFEIIKAFNDYYVYAKTNNTILYREKPLNVSSVQNFEFIPEHMFWARDGVNYFYLDRKINTGNYKDIDIIIGGWFKDKQFVYNSVGDTLRLKNHSEKNIERLDIKSIEKTELYGFLKDKYGYINGNDNKRITNQEYKYYLKHDN